PDLVSVGNFRANLLSPPLTLVDFTFDQAATKLALGFKLVAKANQTDIACTYSSGTGTTTLTVSCPQYTGAVSPSSSNTARGWVLKNTVKSASGALNPLQAAAVSEPTTSTPHL